MKKVALGDICQVISGSTPKRNRPEFWGGEIPWVTPKEISSLSTPYLEDSIEKITDLGYSSCSAKMLPLNSILLSSRAPIGLLAINKIKVCTNQGFKSLIPSSEVHTEYLYYSLKHSVKALQSRGNGATFKELSKSAVQAFKIPLPPMENQKRIAYLLGKIERTIAQRKQHLGQLDNLLKIIFLDLFGFLDSSFENWNKNKLGSHADVVSGVTKGKKYEEKNLIQAPYMRVANVQDRYFDLSEIKTISVTTEEVEKYRLQKGDLLLTEGGDRDKLGRGSVWENQISDCIHQNHIFRVRVDDLTELNPYYLSALVSSRYGKAYFLKSAKQTTGIASINSTQLKKFPVLIPPISLQNKFAEIVRKVESIKSSYQKSLAAIENLYGSVSQKAFNGNLDLSRIPLLAKVREDMPVADTQQTTKAIPLSTRSVLTNLTSTKNRNEFIKQWMIFWFDLIKDESFSSNLFMLATQQRLSELAEDEAVEIGIEEYQKVRDWLFSAIQRGQIEQTLNKIILDDKQEFGNRVILNKTSQR